jgi:ABC-type branched-subunit amino acid transport system substrate-binding protein
MTGITASGNASGLQGLEAGIDLAKSEGYNIKYVLADTSSSVSGALTAAQNLVEVHHVFAVMPESSFTVFAAPFLKSHGVPVVGSAEDGPEWLTDGNMFSPYGAGIGSGTVPVISTVGAAMKLEGVTNAAVLAYNYSTSALAGKEEAKSIEDAGIKVGYLNLAFPLSSVNTEPVALAMKAAGINGFVAPLSPSTALSTIENLKQLGITLKGAFLFNGYGGDLQTGGPGAQLDAQGVFFGVEYEPVEMHTAATEQLQHYLQAVGVTGDPTFAEYNGYLSVAMMVEGLKAAGSRPTQASFISALDRVNWNAIGLLGNHHQLAGNRGARPQGIDGCTWLTQLEGSHFNLVKGADPLCGTAVDGQTVSE